MKRGTLDLGGGGRCEGEKEHLFVRGFPGSAHSSF
jgi:hypothetical protein